MTGNSEIPEFTDAAPFSREDSPEDRVAVASTAKKKRQYIIDMQPYFEYGKSQTGWWTKGHHECQDVVIVLLDVGFSIPDRSDRTVRHEYWRAMPYDKGYVFVPSSGSSMGDFPVTILEDPEFCMSMEQYSSKDTIRNYSSTSLNGEAAFLE